MNDVINLLLISGGLLYLFASGGALVFHNKLHRSFLWSNLWTAGGGVLMLSGALFVLLGKAGPSHQIPGPYPWMTLTFGIDKLGAFFLFCLSLLTVFVSIYSQGYEHHRTLMTAVFQPLFVLGMAGLLMAQDVISFLFFWEVMSFASYFLIIAESDKAEARRAGNLYLLMTQFGTSLIMIALLGLAAHSGSASFQSLRVPGLAPVMQGLLFVAMLLGFGTKAGMIPLHVWLPKAHPAAPTPVSALMSGFMIKAAIYGLLRFTQFLPGQTWQGTVVILLGVFTALLGIIYAFMENDFKRLLAYCSIENIGIILVGVGLFLWGRAAGHPFLSNLALIGLEMQVLHHTLFKGLMFMSAGAVMQECHTRNLEKLGGLIKRMPQTVFFSLIGAATGAGLPFTSGFISEWLILQALFLAATVLVAPGLKIIAFVGIGAFALVAGFAAATFVKLFGIGFLALPRSAAAAKARESNGAIRLAMGFSALGCLLVGVFPRLPLSLTSGGLKLCGAFTSFPGWGIAIQANTIDPPLLCIGLVAVIALTAVLLGKRACMGRFAFGPTWNCGTALQPQMEYSGASFAKLAKLVFKVFLRPQRKLIKHYDKNSQLISALEYQSSLPSHFEERLYQPVVRIMMGIAGRIRWLQAGSIKLYLSYILIVLLLLLLYLRLG